MASAGDMVVNLGLDRSKFSQGLQQSRGDLSGFASSLKSTLSTAAAGVAGLVGVGGGLASLGLGVKLAADLEQTTVAFTTMLGSAEQAKSTLDDIAQFAASTPFEKLELTQASQKLLAFGTSAGELIPTLRAIGDVSAGIGAPITEIAEIYGKARVQGRLFAEDINQLTGRGIPIIQELAKQFGITDSEVKKLVESGQVNFTHLQAAFQSLTGEGGKFFNLMDAQSQTLGGLFSSLKDEVTESLTLIGQEIITQLDLKQVVSDGIALIQRWRDTIIGAVGGVIDFIKDWKHTLESLIFSIVAVKTAMLAIAAVQAVIAARQAIINVLSGPAGWAAIAVGLFTAGTALAEVSGLLGDSEKELQKISETAPEVEKVSDGLKEMGSAASAIRQAANATRDLAAATKEAAETSKKYLTDAQKLRNELRELDALREANRQITVGHISDEQFAGFRQQAIDRATGVFSQIKELQNEIERLRGAATETGQALRKMIEDGAPPEAVERLRGLMELRDRMQKQRDRVRQAIDRRQELREQLATPAETFFMERQRLQQEFQQGIIPEDLFLRAVDRALKEFEDADPLHQFAKNLRESLKSPQQEFNEQMAKLNEARSKNLITQQEFVQGREKARQEFTQATKPQGPAFAGAVDAFSREGQTRIAQLTSGGSDRTQVGELRRLNSKFDKLLAKTDRQLQQTDPRTAALARNTPKIAKF